MQITLNDLEQCFNEGIKNNKKFIGIKIRIPDAIVPEIIINPYENFENKLAYYKRAYNNDLTLKTFRDIKIVDFTCKDCLCEIEKELLCGGE